MLTAIEYTQTIKCCGYFKNLSFKKNYRDKLPNFALSFT